MACLELVDGLKCATVLEDVTDRTTAASTMEEPKSKEANKADLGKIMIAENGASQR